MDLLLTGSQSPIQPQALTVSQLVERMKNAIRISVGHQWVEGEISNLRVQSSGHSYFTLKDAGAQIACVLFKQRASGCKVALKEGIKVRVYGEATMYEQRGQVQLILSKIEAIGLGDLQARFLELKARLEAEGLFNPGVKKKIPAFPRAIGIITSPTGAAMQDMRNVFEQRAPWVKIYLYPVLVQGDEAAAQIAAAIQQWGRESGGQLPAVDTLIIARGGGSIEDLWSFNEEIVARAIFECPLPVISGVGHETDFTIADFVADLRAPTPTAAAMSATPDGNELFKQFTAMEQVLKRRAQQYYEHANLRLSFAERSKLADPVALLEPFAQQVDELEHELYAIAESKIHDGGFLLRELELRLKGKHPRMLHEQRWQMLSNLQNNLVRAFKGKISGYPQELAFVKHKLFERAGQRLEEAAGQMALFESKIESRSPQKTLERGYALVQDKSGRIIRSTHDVHEGDLLEITLNDGQIKAKAE